MFLKNGRKKRSVKREFSAGGAVFRRKVSKVPNVSKAQEVEWLVIRHKGSKEWRLPKGKIEKGENSRDAAVREVWEETGIKAQIVEKLDTIQYFYILKGSRFFKRVTFFLMEALGGNPRIDKRWRDEVDKAAWLPSEEVITKLAFKSEKEIVRKGMQAFDKNT